MNETQSQQAFHPVMDVNAGVYNSYTGKLINLLNPTEDAIDIFDIAHALSNIVRFGGHRHRFYSVAQHSVLVSHICHPSVAKEALLHDASEAYLGDVIKPLKVLLGAGYENLETNFDSVISALFGIDNSKGVKGLVKSADLHALEMEHLALIQRSPLIMVTAMVRSGMIDEYPKQYEYAWTPDVAFSKFMERFNQLFK